MYLVDMMNVVWEYLWVLVDKFVMQKVKGTVLVKKEGVGWLYA